MGVGISSMAKISGSVMGAVGSALAIAKEFDKPEVEAKEKEDIKQAAENNIYTYDKYISDKNKDIKKAAEANRISLDKIVARKSQQEAFKERLGMSTGGEQ